MHNVRRLTWPVLFALLMAGCATQPPAPVEPVTPPSPPPVTQPLPGIPVPTEYPDAMLTTPKVRNYAWKSAVAPMISTLLQSNSGSPAGVLLISQLSNQTNGTLPASQLISALHEALKGNSQFTLIPAQQADAARQQLGLLANDKLITRGKALATGRVSGADYVLYTSASGNVQAPTLHMQLLMVKSGEIVWSGSGDVQQQAGEPSNATQTVTPPSVTSPSTAPQQ